MVNDSELLSIGIMTGNSLDGADLVLTRFNRNGQMKDLCALSKSMPAELGSKLRQIRTKINDLQGDMSKVSAGKEFDDAENSYTHFISSCVDELLSKAKLTFKDADVVGSHGQTCAHCPPSVASKKGTTTYTVQIGDGQKLADLTGISVVCDFRSDDVMHGGEGAPLAPIHHQHIAEQLEKQGRFPIAFCNAGNTGNISVISRDEKTLKLSTVGWDAGPFSNFPDKLAQAERNVQCDIDGILGKSGKINLELLSLLFHTAVTTEDGKNFLLSQPPKSSDPAWYKIIPELAGKSPVSGKTLSLEDRMRTAEYFSAYVLAHTLSHLSSTSSVPGHYALSGGGWRNPLSRQDFHDLVSGSGEAPVLEEHREAFGKIQSAAKKNSGGVVTVEDSVTYGFDGTAMEARIFADAAVCRIKGVPFSTPETTGTIKETVAGIIRFPKKDIKNATAKLQQWLQEFKSTGLTTDNPEIFDGRWSRASAGWKNKLLP